MPDIPGNIVRVQMVFETEPAVEIVTNTFHMRRDHITGNQVDWPVDLVEIVTKVKDKFNGAPGNAAKAALSSITKLTAIHAYTLGQTHPHHATNEGHLTGITGVTGTGSVNPLPFDVSVVVSLRTQDDGETLADPDSGPSPLKQSRGRLYLGVLPAPSVGVNGRFTSAYCTTVADGWAAFLNDLHMMEVGPAGPNGIDRDKLELGVLSRAAGSFRVLRDIVVDDLPDTQRRRSNRQMPNRLTREILQS